MSATFDPPDVQSDVAARENLRPPERTASQPQASDRLLAAGRPAGIKSPTVLSMNLTGWLLLGCMFLPLCRSCGGTVVHPIDQLSSAFATPVHANDVGGAVLLLSVYGYGALAALLITLSAWFRSRALWWRSFWIQFALSVTLATVIACLIMIAPPPKERLSNFLAIVPPLAGATTWIAAAIRRGERPLAWARLQHIWTIIALVHLHLLCLFASDRLFGYWLTLVSLLAMVLTVELARHRLDHDLWDASQPVARPRFTLRQVFVWMTLLPLVVAYYQSIRTFADWFFPDP